MQRVVTVISHFLKLLPTAAADCLLQNDFALLDLVFLVWLGRNTKRIKIVSLFYAPHKPQNGANVMTRASSMVLLGQGTPAALASPWKHTSMSLFTYVSVPGI